MDGLLTTFLGTAPGVGKTYAMLVEGRGRAAAGQRVVVGWVEHKARPETNAQLEGLEVIPPRAVIYKGHHFPELDVAGALAAKPDLVVVDDLAHAWPDGTRKRWMDVADILGAGLDVLTSVNFANLVSARDYAARITGTGAVEPVPDEFVRSGEIVLVDLPADALRRRIASGHVYSADQVGGALAEYFRVPNLDALSELARAWLAGALDEVAADLLARRGLGATPTNPLVVAGVSGSAAADAVIKRAVEIACNDNADLLVVQVLAADGSLPSSHRLARQQKMAERAGAGFAQVTGEHMANALAEVVRARGASTVVVARWRPRLVDLARGSVASQLRRLLPDIAVDEVLVR